MSKHIFFGAVVFSMFLSISMSTQAEDSPDMAAYIEEIRESGISEQGQMSIYSVISIRLGHSVLEYRKDESSGMYWPSYRSTICALPGADPEEMAAWRVELGRQRKEELILLRPYADIDGSGFVTTAEGSAFRKLVEFGYLAVQIAEDGIVSLVALATASGKSLQDVEAELTRYLQLVEQIQAAGLETFPTVGVQTPVH